MTKIERNEEIDLIFLKLDVGVFSGSSPIAISHVPEGKGGHKNFELGARSDLQKSCDEFYIRKFTSKEKYTPCNFTSGNLHEELLFRM